MTHFIESLESIKPYIIGNDRKVSEGPNVQTPAQLEKYRQFSMCINCGLCYAACPQFGLNPEFVGPGVLALAQRYNTDSRDHGAVRSSVIALKCVRSTLTQPLLSSRAR